MPIRELDVALSRLNGESNSTRPKVEHKFVHNGGRGNGSSNLSPLMRELVGTLAHLDTTKNISKEFSIPANTIDMAKVGKHSSTMPVDEELKSKIEDNLNKRKEEIIDHASSKLLETMGLITPVDIANEKVTARVVIAKDLASIVEKMSPKQSNAPTFANVTIIGVQNRDEDEYPTKTLIREENQ